MLLTELGLSRAQLREAQTVPVERIVAAQAAVQSKLAARVPGFIQGFSPVVDGATLPTPSVRSHRARRFRRCAFDHRLQPH